ncbi:uncharacterized protein B0I36DRAFT_369312 [Microdochium trichocladiopsis]|uniref:Uncharacterized protein n=1 Tax=Microdochium trichocladiopsis TaxID=1682393 RepID=A0A9P8XRV2_9PEZI|nr:uncharacterized protein B0I36DRAFT_369312 [Microdochium trichocladiopsis]KAH7014345.1 hypothetical protein B0I36DRAFT_369312 [Microdochium trichocladiopsis]
MQTGEFASVFDQIAPRCYVSVAQYFRTSADQDTRRITAHLQQAVRNLITVQPCLGGVLSEDDTAFIRFHSRPVPELNDIEIREIDCRQVSFADLEEKHYGPSYCCNPEFAVPPPNSEFVPVFRAAICWYQDGFAVLTFLHHTVADGLSCQYLIEALAAVTWDEIKLPRHRQLRFGEPSWKSMVRRGSIAPSTSSSAPASASSRQHGQHEAVQFDQHCAYAAKGCESGPLAHRGTTTPPGPLTQLLVQVSTPGTDDASCTRFCKRAAQAWILTMTSRDRAGRFKRRHEMTTGIEADAEEDEPLADLLFAVGLNRADDELGSRAVYSKVSYPVSRLIKALDDPAEVRKLEIHISKAVETARLPQFRRAYEETFENYFREGGDPSRIQVSADQADPYVFIFNTWRFMGKTGDRVTPIRWKFPCFSSPKAPDCIRKVASGYGGASYGLVQPSTRVCRDGKRSPDEILITLESGDAREFTALVDEQKHAGITSCWEVLDMIEQTA